MLADIIVDLQYGDCGKGKVAHHLCKNYNYTHVLRYNGGCNAGHTIYHEGVKFVTHHIPCGVFFGVKSIIGPGCVVHPDTFLEDIENLESHGIDATNLVKIATNAHVITDFHRAQDKVEEGIGTTKRGNGPAYRDKYARKGIRAVDMPILETFLVDVYNEFHENEEFKEIKVLCEGAQGFGLDIDWGDYPYVTSSHCTVGGAILNGIPHDWIRDVWGIAKVYETYVGKKAFEGIDPLFSLIREIGEEFGSTTGRARQINWLDWALLKTAVNINGVNKVVFNKTDVLEQIKTWRLMTGIHLFEVDSSDDMQYWIEEALKDKEVEVFFSGDKEKI